MRRTKVTKALAVVVATGLLTTTACTSAKKKTNSEPTGAATRESS
ncbi:MAG: hypothetical protein QOF87_4218, partial [Pseudonocardiales bacterium]|nr:hypothetical protein [Pseudonocardiales bacterium]